MTVEEKRIALSYYCDSCDNCKDCRLYNECTDISPSLTPRGASDDVVEKLYAFYEKLKGEPIMNENALNVTKAEEKTITIAVSEYRFLISERSTLSKLEGYAETHEYLSDDVIRALLGVEKPAANLESEGD